jgi:hypothetical protein
MSKTNREREEKEALSKNHGRNVRYRRRMIEDQEAKEERERALQELIEENQRLGMYDDQR